MAPRVSVIVPMYRCSRTIAATIGSAQRQTFADLEIVAVDDASPDDSAAIVERIAAEDPRVRLVRNPRNIGIAGSCNHGVRASRGELVATLDSDDVWAPTKIEQQVRALDAAGPGYGFAYCPFQRIDGEDRVLFSAPVVEANGWAFLPVVVYNFVGNGSAILMRRAAFEDVGGFIENKGAYSSDDLLIVLLLAGRWKMCCVPEYLVGYRLVAGSVSSAYIRGCHSYLRVLDIVQERYPDAPRRPIDERRAETLGKYALYHAETGALRDGLRWFAAALRADPRFAMKGVSFYLRQKAMALRARLSGPKQGGVNYFSPDNDRRALRPLTGVKARQVARAFREEAAYRGGA